MKQWQRRAAIMWVVLVAGGAALTFFLDHGTETPSPAPPPNLRPSPVRPFSDPCSGANVICSATFVPSP
ncbi:hypothetical protein [Streptomyces sp. NRRL S-350]|uniref:hypothetical protein n=1 Tax=Streptomyces sp. NRRL S-350 TaxID=1463902 RepID=UPI000A4E7FEC|nr:hypothetical protein [Streptomyces sp. NRRL S-350]